MLRVKIWYGGDYNPEQWPREVWAEDMKLMSECEVSLVSVGIFAWASVEPQPGRFEFGWFDRVMDNLAEAGVGASLATMTASPPAWLSLRYPESLPQRQDGTRLWSGGRQHYCPSSPVYREHAARLVDQVARRYAKHPALRIWHVGNEFGCHVAQCFCDVSAAGFRRWLQERYGRLEALNEVWSTAFWSQRYSDWEEILPPRTAPTFLNPAHKLDFARFSDDALLECYLLERDIIRKHSDAPVTTNFIGLVNRPVDVYRWSRELDVVSYDSYPDPFDARAHVGAALGYDLIRGARDGQPWLLMEQAPSAVNWRERNAPKAPGMMRLWSWQAIAQGADAVMFFQWRQAAGGAERFHSAMVPHGGTQTRTYQEIRALGQELAGWERIAGTRVEADVALLHDWDNWHAVEGDAHPGVIDLIQTLRAHYDPFFDAHVTCDVVPPSADLSKYKLVVVPNLYLMRRETAQALTSFVRGGGILVVSFFTGIVDESERTHLGGYPAPLREVLGLRIDEFWPLPAGGTIVVNAGNESYQGTIWSEWVQAEGAQVMATFGEGVLAGRPAVTRHEFGAGVAWYLATRPEPPLMRVILEQAREDAGVLPVLPGLADQVQAVRRGEHLILLNHGDTEVSVSGVTLAPRDVKVMAG